MVESDNLHLDARFWCKVYINEDNPDACWLWIAGCDGGGYGRYHIKGEGFKSHRLSYQDLVAPLNIALQINHKCSNIICVNPWHLYQGTQVDNVKDAIEAGTFRSVLAEREKAKEYCPRRHELSGDNLTKEDYRHCRICSNERRRNKRTRLPPNKRIHCPQGHELSGDNLVLSQLKVGRRNCRICTNNNARRRRG